MIIGFILDILGNEGIEMFWAIAGIIMALASMAYTLWVVSGVKEKHMNGYEHKEKEQ